MAGLALILHVIELFAQADHLRSECLGFPPCQINVGSLHDHGEVIREDGCLFRRDVELRHAESERRAQGLRILQEVDDPLALRAAALKSQVGRQRAAVAVQAMAHIALVAFVELAEGSGRPECGVLGGL
jgi:hypothetical protein